MDHYTEVVVIIDRSGSMSPFLKDTVGGYNSFIKKQKELPGDAKLTTVIFDDHYEVLENAIDIKNAREMTENDFRPRGMTALLDAIGKTISNLNRRMDTLMAMDRTNKVLFAIITDGQENASREYNKHTIKALIEQHTAKGWKFDFLSASLDAIQEAYTIGIPISNTMNFTNTSKGVDHSYQVMTMSASAYRSGSSFNVKDQEGKEDQ